MTGIDTPQLGGMQITFLNQNDFYTPRLAHFINRTPKLTKRGARLQFDDNSARVVLQSSYSTRVQFYGDSNLMYRTRFVAFVRRAGL